VRNLFFWFIKTSGLYFHIQQIITNMGQTQKYNHQICCKGNVTTKTYIKTVFQFLIVNNQAENSIQFNKHEFMLVHVIFAKWIYGVNPLVHTMHYGIKFLQCWKVLLLALDTCHKQYKPINLSTCVLHNTYNFFTDIHILNTYIHTHTHIYIPWIQMLVKLTIGCGIRHKVQNI
jgi:hypothetical protein